MGDFSLAKTATLTRRKWLARTGASAMLALAGCLVTDEGQTDPVDAGTTPNQTNQTPAAPDTETDDTTPAPDNATAALNVDLSVPETVATGIEDAYQLRMTNTDTTATTVEYGVDVRRPQMVFQTLVTGETILDPDDTYTDTTRAFSNWERGPFIWTAWARSPSSDDRVTTTASTTVTLSTRPWGSAYRPVTGHRLSMGQPTLMESYTDTRADGTTVSLSATARTQLVVIGLRVSNTTRSQRRTPDADGFHLRAGTRAGRQPRVSIGTGTTQPLRDLAPGDSERWTLVYEVPADVTQADLSLTHTGGGYYTDGGWQVRWQ